MTTLQVDLWLEPDETDTPGTDYATSSGKGRLWLALDNQGDVWLSVRDPSMQGAVGMRWRTHAGGGKNWQATAALAIVLRDLDRLVKMSEGEFHAEIERRYRQADQSC